MFAPSTPHSKVVHVQVPVLLPGAVDVGHHLAAVDCAAHGGPPGGADGALEVLTLGHGLLQAQEDEREDEVKTQTQESKEE